MREKKKENLGITAAKRVKLTNMLAGTLYTLVPRTSRKKPLQSQMVVVAISHIIHN